MTDQPSSQRNPGPQAQSGAAAQPGDPVLCQSLYAMLSQANQTMLRATSEVGLFEAICRICVEHGPFGLAWIAVLQEGQVCQAAAAGPMQGYLEGLHISPDPQDPLGRGPTGRAFRGERQVVSDDWATDPLMDPWRELGARFGIRSSGCFPVRTEHGVEAALTLYADRPGLFDQARIDLLEELAGNVAFALDKFRAQRERQEDQARLAEALNRWSATFDALEEAICLLDLEGHILQANAGFAKLLGWSPEAAQGHRCHEIHHNNLDFLPQCPFQAMLRSGHREALQVQMRDRWYEVVADPLCDSQGILIGAVHVLRDITDQKEAVARARHQQELYGDLVGALPLGIYRLLVSPVQALTGPEWETIYPAHYQVEFVSEQFCAIIGLDRAAFQASPALMLERIHPEDRRSFSKRNAEAMTQKRPFLWEGRLAGKNPVQWIRFESSPRSLSEGYTLWTGVLQDISEERQAADRLARSHEVLSGIMESAEGPIFSVDRAYRYTSFNKAHAAVMKAVYGREITLGSSLLEHQTVQADRDIAKANLERALAGEAFTEQAMSGEEHLSRHYFEVTHTPIYNIAEGNVTGVAVFARNITQRHQSESALHRVTDLLSLVGHIAGVGGWELDLEEQSLYWTDQTYTIHDLEPGAYTPMLETAIQFYAPEGRPVITAAVQTAIETGQPFDLELELITARNRRIWVRTNAQVISRDGRAVKVLGAFQDITERKRNEEALRESNRRLQLATDSADMAVWDWDLQTGTMTWDDRMFELYGMTRLETQGTGQDWIDSLHPEDLERAMTESKAALMGSAPYATEFRIKQRDGTFLWVKANATVLRNPEGKPVRMVGVNQDITKEKELEAEIRNLNRGLERRVEQRTHQLAVAKDELEAFAYSVSHDLRAPLRAISGFAEALSLDADSLLSVDGLQHLQRIRGGSNRMAQLIEDLLKLSRIGRDDFIAIPLDLADLAEQVLAGLRSAQPERLVDCRIQHPIPVQGDPRLLRVLLENLLGNAWKFTARVPSACIELSARPLGEATMEISIRDNGAGFPSSQAAKLFTPFHRLHKESDFPGTGIGLAIAKRIVTRHGGFIRAEGEPGLGAAFHFNLPTVKEEQP